MKCRQGHIEIKSKCKDCHDLQVKEGRIRMNAFLLRQKLTSEHEHGRHVYQHSECPCCDFDRDIRDNVQSRPVEQLFRR